MREMPIGNDKNNDVQDDNKNERSDNDNCKAIIQVETRYNGYSFSSVAPYNLRQVKISEDV